MARPKMESECGQAIENASQAIDHATECCSVGRVRQEPEVETETTVHWGVRLPGGVIRWDPGYGSGVYIPYTEAEARTDMARTPGATLVTRTQTVVTTTTPWKETP